MPRRPVVGGNWKCNPASKSALDELIANINACDTSACDVYVCPSPLHVDYCSGKMTGGAMVTPQNCNFKGLGAFTGEMAVEQMKDLGITNVLIGHSERRGEFGIFPMDNDSTLAAKLKYILDAGMTCVFCIGEPKEIREKGLEEVLKVMDTQLAQIYGLLDPAKVVIAYEPVWAIGTGLTATPADAQATHEGIRRLIAVEVDNLKKNFDEANQDGSGTLTREEFIKLGGLCYSSLDAAEIGRTCDSLAASGTTFDFDGFMRGFVALEKVEYDKVLGRFVKKRPAGAGADAPANTTEGVVKKRPAGAERSGRK